MKSKFFFIGLFFLGLFFSASAAELSPEERAKLERDLQQIEKEIIEQQGILNKKRTEGVSIERDIAILNAQIKGAQLKIKKHNLAIDQLGKDITIRASTIQKLDSEIEAGQESLAQILRKTNELDDHSLPEVILSNSELSEFFADLDSFQSVKVAMAETFVTLRDTKEATETEKVKLGEKRNQEIDTRVNVESEKKKIETAEAEKKRLLSLNKAEQAGYQKVISDKAAKASQIRAALFPLIDTGPIKFEDALKYANAASRATGVRAAFILGILKQETNLGANVGQCLLTDPATGEGKGKNTGTVFQRVMKADRDVAPFLDITKRLGKDPYATVVSCPQAIGYGGAMGPSQFIPSTWVSYEGRVAAALGVPAANPWNAEHAFTATALFLKDLGAAKGGYSAEQEAAARYYAGGAWAKNGLGYAASVLSFATTFQSDIDFLSEQ